MEKYGMTIQKWDTVIRHPLQSWTWGQFRQAMGIDVVRLDISTEEHLQCTFHCIPHTPWTIGYIPKGPLPTQKMIETLTRLGKQKNAIFIQLEPNILASSKQQNNETLNLLSPSHHPLFTKYTFILDLTGTEEDLLKNLHEKTRYNIRLAKRRGVSIQEDNSDSAFSDYLRLTHETTQRQKFFAHNDLYHRMMWKILKDAGIAKLWTATYRGETLAAWILFVWKKTVYYPYGASSRLHKELMAPNLLLWEIALWGKKNGYTAFDLWGAIGPHPDPEDPWYGFHRFKEGYHPDLVEYIGSYDLIIKPLLYILYTVGDTVRWWHLKHR